MTMSPRGIQHHLARTVGVFLMSVGALLASAGSCRAAVSCDASSNCTSTVQVYPDGQGGCTYKWDTRDYQVAKGTQPLLLWQLADPVNYAWDSTNGVTIVSIFDPAQDVDSGRALDTDKSYFQWLARQMPVQSKTGDKVLNIKFEITPVNSTKACKPQTGEPPYYTITLKR